MPRSPTPPKKGKGLEANRKRVKRIFDVVIEKDESGWFVATVPAVRGAVSQGRTLSEAKKNIVEAIELMLEEPRSAQHESTFVGIHRVEISA